MCRDVAVPVCVYMRLCALCPCACLYAPVCVPACACGCASQPRGAVGQAAIADSESIMGGDIVADGESKADDDASVGTSASQVWPAPGCASSGGRKRTGTQARCVWGLGGSGPSPAHSNSVSVKFWLFVPTRAPTNTFLCAPAAFQLRTHHVYDIDEHRLTGPVELSTGLAPETNREGFRCVSPGNSALWVQPVP